MYATCPLSALANACTAFPNWLDLVNALQGGYVPTLFGRTRRERLLRKCILASGFSVWPLRIQGE